MARAADKHTPKRTSSRRSTSRQSGRGSQNNPSKTSSKRVSLKDDAYWRLREYLEPNEAVQLLTALLCQWPLMPSWIRRKNSDGEEIQCRVPVEDWQNKLLILTVEFDDATGNDCLGIHYTGYSHPSLSDGSGGPAEILVRAADVEREARRVERGERLWDGNSVISDYDPIAEFEREIEGQPRTPPRLYPITAPPAPTEEPTPLEKSAAKAKLRKPKQPRKKNTTDDALVVAPGKELTFREKYKRFTADDDLVAEGVNGIRSGTWPNPSRAATALADRAKGSSPESTITRLRKKIGMGLEG